MRAYYLPLVVLGMFPPTVQAQRITLIDNSEELRITYECDAFRNQQSNPLLGCREHGKLERTTADSLVLLVNSGATEMAIAWGNVLRIERKFGKKISTGRIVGFPIVGSFVCGLAGGLVGKAACASCGSDTQKWTEGIGTLAGAGFGLVVGFVVGYTWRTDRWETVRSDRLRVIAIGTGEGRYGIGLNVSF